MNPVAVLRMGVEKIYTRANAPSAAMSSVRSQMTSPFTPIPAAFQGEPDAAVLEFRRKMVFYTECFAEVTVVCIAFSAAEYIDLYGWALAPIFAVVWVVLCLIVNTILRKKGVISDG